MAVFSVSMLRHSAKWNLTESEGTQVEGFPQSVLFNWKEGYEVLHFINRYMEYRGWQSDVTFQRIETLIKTRMPFAAKSHYDVMVWLDATLEKQ